MGATEFHTPFTQQLLSQFRNLKLAMGSCGSPTTIRVVNVVLPHPALMLDCALCLPVHDCRT